MDKRIAENTRVKNQIANAFFDLLKKCKDIEDTEKITVSMITAEAHVSRMAYYRNFTSKIDIINYYLDNNIWLTLSNHLNTNFNFWTLEYGIDFFNVMKEHKDIILLLDKYGYSNLILNAFNQTNENVVGDMPCNSIERFKIYYAAGASYNSVIIWLKENCKEAPEDMAKSFQEFCRLLDM